MPSGPVESFEESSNLAALLITYIPMEQVCVSVQKQDGCLLHSLKTVTICNFSTSWLSTVHFVAAIVYTVGAKIT